MDINHRDKVGLIILTVLILLAVGLYVSTGPDGGSFFERIKKIAYGVEISNFKAAELTPSPVTVEQILIFEATADATVKKGSPNANFGKKLNLQADASPMENFLVKFSVSGISGRKIKSAKLRLYGQNPAPKGGGRLYSSDTSWNEGTVTWNNAPVAGALITSLGAVESGKWYELDVTSAVTGDTPVGFKVDSLSSAGTGYQSREAVNKPQLVVTVESVVLPVVELLSPQGGEQWMRGNAYNISWILKNGAIASTASLFCYKPTAGSETPTYMGAIEYNLPTGSTDPQNPNTYVWNIPTMAWPASCPAAETGLYIDVMLRDSFGNIIGSDMSGLITIVAPSPTPIPVISSAISGSTPPSKITAGGSTVTALAVDFAAMNGDFLINQLDFATVNSGAELVVNSLVLRDGNTVLGILPLNGNRATFPGLNVNVPKNSIKTLTAQLQFSYVGVYEIPTGLDAKLSLTGFKARDLNGIGTNDTTLRTGNSIYVHRSYPSVSAVSLPTTVLQNGTQTISKFRISANNNRVNIKKFVWNVTKSAGVVPVVPPQSSPMLLEDGIDLQGGGTFVLTDLYAGSTTGTITFTPNNEIQIDVGSPKMYELKADIFGTLSPADIIVTELKTNTSPTASPGTFYAVDSTSAKLIWSDVSAQGHSPTTQDWMNDYLIALPVSQWLSR